MGTTPLRCRVGFHTWVQARPPGERLQGPDHKVCSRCGKKRTTDFGAVPPGFFGGAGG